MDKDGRFSREFKNAIEEFGEDNIEHGVYFFEHSKYDGVGKIVFKESKLRGVNILDYIEERDSLKVSGGGKHNQEDVTVAKVV